MDRVWHTSKYSPKPLVNLYQANVIRGHEVKKVKPLILRTYLMCDACY